MGEADAEDVVQQAFCAILELDRSGASEIVDVRAWLHRIVRTRALNALRADRRRRGRERERSGGRCVGEDRPDGAVAELVEALPHEQREVIVLRHAAGLTFDQIALATGVARSTLASRHRAAIESLRAGLAEGPFQGRCIDRDIEAIHNVDPRRGNGLPYGVAGDRLNGSGQQDGKLGVRHG